MKNFQLFLLSFVLFVSSCGFQLRGQYQIPESLQFVVIQGEVGSELLSAVKKQFKLTGINVIDDAENIPRAIVNLSLEKYTKTVNTLATSGQIKDYNLNYSAVFNVTTSKRLKQANKRINISSQKVQVHRVLTVNQSSLLSSGSEELTIKAEMRSELARSILFRIQALTKRKPTPKY